MILVYDLNKFKQYTRGLFSYLLKKEGSMSSQKALGWKILFLVLFAVLVDLILHMLFARRVEYNFSPSIFIEKGLFLPAVSIALLIWFGTLAIIFTLIQNNLPGTKVTKGWRYGIAFGGLCFLAIIEVSLVFDSPLMKELRVSATDSVSILLLGFLLGRFTATEGQHPPRQTDGGKMAFIVTPLVFLVGRYVGHIFLHTRSAYSEKPIATFLWTLGLGGWISVMYWLLKEFRKASAIVHAVRFGGLVFGSYWLIYNSFALLFMKLSGLEVLKRVLIDVFFVSVSIGFVNRHSKEKPEMPKR